MKRQPQARKRNLTRSQPGWSPNRGLPASRTMRNKFLLLKLSVHGILLRQPKQIRCVLHNWIQPVHVVCEDLTSSLAQGVVRSSELANVFLLLWQKVPFSFQITRLVGSKMRIGPGKALPFLGRSCLRLRLV